MQYKKAPWVHVRLLRCSIGLLTLLMGIVLQGCASLPNADVSLSSNAEATLGTYRLKPSDPLFIRFTGIMEQQSLELIIDENGEIGLLHIDKPIQAANLTTSELEDQIERLYIQGDIYKNVSVHVTMTAKVFYVQGEVIQPGQFPLTSRTTLLQAIAAARGYTPYANKKKVTIARGGSVMTYNLKELEENPSKDITIEAGDVIKVWQQWF